MKAAVIYDHGGPGSILSGLIMVIVSLYLRSAWPDRG